MKMQLVTRAIGAPLDRIDGAHKVTGTATYAYEYPVEGVTYVFPVQSTIAKGRVVSIDASAAQALPGVIAVLSHENAPRLAPLDDVELRADRGDLSTPERLSNGDETDTRSGDVEAALASSPISLDHTYTTPAEHHNPLEPHATLAVWGDDSVTLYDANQGADWIRNDVARAFKLPPERVRVIARYVGGGFGSKLFAHPHMILTVMAARVTRRPVKLALTRQQMFAVAGYRTPTIQRMRLGADSTGRLTTVAHDVVEQTATIYEFAEQTAIASRVMYAAPNRRTTHRLARLDVPVPTFMRAPGECPGMFAIESAIDELAVASGLDPIELRIRNEPAVDPETGHPFSSRNLVACLREGAQRFGWAQRDPTPGTRREGRWLSGTGVA